jgi:D-glycero-D-manno-heptose 1,7-bisphosphate phosphatase
MTVLRVGETWPGAVFLDRDGVINENRVDHVKDWSEFSFLPGSLVAIAELSRRGARVFIISNQAVVNRGVVSRETVDDINRRMLEVIEGSGGRVEGIAYCPHLPEESCFCRKPRPGLLLELALTHGIDLRRSTVIGDALSDVEAGQAAGCRTVLVMTGRGREQRELAGSRGVNGFLVAPDLRSATRLVLEGLRRSA